MCIEKSKKDPSGELHNLLLFEPFKRKASDIKEDRIFFVSAGVNFTLSVFTPDFTTVEGQKVG